MNARPRISAKQRLRYERELRGWSQKRVADAVGTNKFMISRWEKGVTKPSPHFREQLCLLFGKTAEELGFISLVTSHEETVEVPPFWYVPLRRNPFFTGRTRPLEELDTLLQANPAVALTQSYALHGLGGIGKTQLAVEYAYQHALKYTAIFWIGAESVENIITSFLAIAEVLQLPQRQEADQQQIVTAVQRWLITHAGWLLIWDNLEDLALLTRFLPSVRQGVILLTTRTQAVGTLAQGIEVQTMGPEEGILLLLHRAKVLARGVGSGQLGQFAGRLPTEYTAAHTLVTLMGGLPLALDQAGAYIEETGCRVSDYLERYMTQRAQLLERRGTLVGDHPESITATFRLASQRLEQDHPLAADLLRICALLHAEAIPEELFTEGALHAGPVLEPLAVDPSQLDLAIAALRTFSLVQRHPETRTFSLHRLVQAVVQEEMGESERKLWQQRAVRMLNALFPASATEAWQQCERFLPHVLTCAASVLTHGEDQDLAEVLHKAAEYLRQRAQYAQVEPLYRRALRIWEQALGPEHPKVATVLNDLARFSYELAQYEQAEALHQRALRIRQQALGPEHPDVATSLNNLAILHEIQGRYTRAEAFYQQSLHIREQVLGLEHPDVASSLNNLAILYKTQGKYEQAEALYQRALRIWQQALGPEHHLVAMSLNNLAVLYKTQGRYERAEAFFQQARFIWEQVLGPWHPYVAGPLEGLADLSTLRAQYGQAETLYQQALHISEQALGPEHPQVAALLNGLADLYRKQRKYEQAEALYQRALHISKQAFGSEHLQVASLLNGLANLYTRQARYEEAEALYQRALMLREQHLGPHHPETARTLADLALLSQDRGRYEQAALLLRRASTIFEQYFGQAHPETVKARNDYQALNCMT